jgi:hypothetical protein
MQCFRRRKQPRGMWVEELDIWRAAKLMVDRYRENAVIETSMKVDQLDANNNLAGRQIWLRILSAVRELQETAPKGTMH